MAKRPAKEPPKDSAPAKRPRAASGDARPRKAQREVELKPAAPIAPGLVVPAPIALEDVAGQDRAIAVLRSSIASDRLHHAWIFHGPPGVGKMTAALAFAAVLLDPSSQPDLSGRINPDPDSSTQSLLRAGTHPDLHVVTKELAAVSREASIRDSKQRNIAKGVLEEFLIEPSTRTSGAASDPSGKGPRVRKVFIVDEAELIDPRGQNALLKTLEEPAPGRVIILVTSREEQLLATIRSRAQRVAFGPLDEGAMRSWMSRAKVDLSGVAPASLDWLLRFSEGSPGTLKTVLTTGIVAWHERLAPMLHELSQGRFPSDLAPAMGKLADEWAQAWVDASEGASKDAANKSAARWVLRLLGDHASHRLRTIASGAKGGSIEEAARWVDAIAECERTIESNVPVAFAFENLVARLASPSIEIA